MCLKFENVCAENNDETVNINYGKFCLSFELLVLNSTRNLIIMHGNVDERSVADVGIDSMKLYSQAMSSLKLFGRGLCAE